MNIDVMRKTLHASEAGTTTFPEVIGALIAEDIDGYHKDLLRHEVTYYLADGRTHAEPMTLRSRPVPLDFNEQALRAAIAAAQRDEVRYPEFIARAMEAGTAAYRVFIPGRRAIYWGRKGDLHVEYFPGAN
ncbi:MAG: DUF1398 family protein [Acidobacteriaceae bacterium]